MPFISAFDRTVELYERVIVGKESREHLLNQGTCNTN